MRCLVCRVVRAIRFVHRFSACADNGRSVVVNCFVVRPDSFWFGERLALARDVCGLWSNEADHIVNRARFVVRDLEEERSDGLPKYFEVVVVWLSNDWL